MTDLLSGVDLPKTFVLYRKVDDSGVSGTGVVATGVQFPDGVVVTRWHANDKPSQTCVWASAEDMMEIHGHSGHTIILWNE